MCMHMYAYEHMLCACVRARARACVCVSKRAHFCASMGFCSCLWMNQHNASVIVLYSNRIHAATRLPSGINTRS